VAFNFVASLDPKHQQRHDLPVIISYEDIHGTAHRTHLIMGKSGIQLCDTSWG
jgi:hypothetical protein